MTLAGIFGCPWRFLTTIQITSKSMRLHCSACGGTNMAVVTKELEIQGLDKLIDNNFPDEDL
jgi:hypothetical protein